MLIAILLSPLSLWVTVTRLTTRTLASRHSISQSISQSIFKALLCANVLWFAFSKHFPTFHDFQQFWSSISLAISAKKCPQVSRNKFYRLFIVFYFTLMAIIFDVGVWVLFLLLLSVVVWLFVMVFDWAPWAVVAMATYLGLLGLRHSNLAFFNFFLPFNFPDSRRKKAINKF